MKINIKTIPLERTRKEIENEYGYYCQIDWEGYGVNRQDALTCARRLHIGWTIGRALQTKTYAHGGARGGTKYNWEGVEINRDTVKGRLRRGRDWESAINTPVGNKKT